MRTFLSRTYPPTPLILDPAPDLSRPQLSALDGLATPALDADQHLCIDPISVLHDKPAQAAEADVDCDIGAAIAILMSRFPVTYTKAFALMLAHSDRTQRSLPDLASAVLKTYSRQPSDTSSRDGAVVSSANRTPAPVTGARR